MQLLLALSCFVLLSYCCACSLLACVPLAWISEERRRYGMEVVPKDVFTMPNKNGPLLNFLYKCNFNSRIYAAEVPPRCRFTTSSGIHPPTVNIFPLSESCCCALWSPASSKSPKLCNLRWLAAINSLEVWRCEVVSANACSFHVRRVMSSWEFITGTQITWILNQGFAHSQLWGAIYWFQVWIWCKIESIHPFNVTEWMTSDTNWIYQNATTSTARDSSIHSMSVDGWMESYTSWICHNAVIWASVHPFNVSASPAESTAQPKWNYLAWKVTWHCGKVHYRITRRQTANPPEAKINK